MQDHTRKIILALRDKFGSDIRPFLTHRNAFEFLVAVILSAQTTDNMVNSVTPNLFSKYPTAESLAKADIEDIEKCINKLNFYRTKAKNIKETSKIICEKHNGEVPDNMEDLISLPGVGRKVANVILADYFGKKEGVVVDTHVKRVSFRIGWTKNHDPEKIEKDLMKVIPKNYWINLPKQMILLGRTFCKPIKPRCQECPINEWCKKSGLTQT